MIINTNAAASSAIYNLDRTNVNLKKSLTRLSSGLRINSALDDPGGLAISLKLSAAIRRTDATSENVSNALLFLQDQADKLSEANDILVRMSDLATLASDSTATSSSSILQAEFDELADGLNSINSELSSLGELPLFTDPSSILAVRTSINTSQTTGITRYDLQDIYSNVSAQSPNLLDSDDATTAVSVLNTQIEALSVFLAINGAQQSRLTFAQEILEVNRLNLEAANSQIMDADIAKESTEYAKQSILAEAGVAMLAQANASPQRALKLLEFN